MKIDIDVDAADRFVLACLKDQLKWYRKDFKSWKYPEDVAYEKKFIEALKVVIAHYGG